MQGLADGYFVIPYTLGNYFATNKTVKQSTDHAEFKRCEAEVAERTRKLLGIKGKKTPVEFHREIGKLLWELCGMARDAAGLQKAIRRIPELREEYWNNVAVPG